MKRVLLSITLAIFALQSFAVEPTREFGVEKTSSKYFDEQYLNNDLVHYLDNADLHITYQAETSGRFNQPDPLIFSVEGSSYRWNNYYIDGFRTDSRFSSGSSIYYTNMSNYDLALDYIDSKLSFTTSDRFKKSLSASLNVGGLGGISAGTAELIRTFHPTAADRAITPIELRSKIKGAGTVDLNYSINGDDRKYMQTLYANYGQRMLVGFDQKGIDSYYPENFLELQLGGELEFSLGGLFDQSYYLANIKNRDHFGSEFYLSEEESSKLSSYSFSLYGVKRSAEIDYTSGFTVAVNDTQHEYKKLNYSRNIVDQDGEAFEPWRPDGVTAEVSYALNINKRLNDWLNLSFDGYNSLLAFNPEYNTFNNSTYSQLYHDEEPTLLYQYDWRSNSFFSGLLENSVGLNTMQRVSDRFSYMASVDLTLDALLVEGNSKLSPNFEFRAGLDYQPTKWLNLGLNLSRERVSYSIEEIQFLSEDYLNGDVYYTNSDGSRGSLFTTTGGKYHTLSKDAKQQNYYVLDIPISANFGRHTITLLHSYRKYNNTWYVGFDGSADDYGYTKHIDTYNKSDLDGEPIPVDVYFFDGGKEINYVVGGYPEGVMGDSAFTKTPFYFSSNIQYSYNAPKFSISVAWQSYMMSGLSALGNGPLHNNLGVLSESMANPNTRLVTRNIDSEYCAVGRLDQDRAYVARIFSSFKVTPKLTMAVNGKFKDGQPFSDYRVELNKGDFGSQAAILPETSRGINTVDSNFGTREDAIFSIEVRARYATQIKGRNCEFGVDCYNIYDFGNELTEHIFNQDFEDRRSAMSVTIPRGLIFSFKMDL